MRPESRSVKTMTRIDLVGTTGFPALLLTEGLITRHDLGVAEQHAAKEHTELAETLVALGIAPEKDVYGLLARAAGSEFVAIEDRQSSELAVRLVPERLARRHVVVPLTVDNRTLTYATCRPFDPETERDLSFASGRRMRPAIAQKSGVLEALERCYPKLRELDVLAARLTG